MRRELGEGLELDDERSRIDREAVHDFLSVHSYWASGRSREVQDALIDASQRVVGLYRQGRQIGFARTVTDGYVHAYLADVYVLPGFRGRGLGVELVRFSVEDGPFGRCRWLLHTTDAHGLYRKFGFGAPDERLLERVRSPVR
jgi:ribosomal protein S18 acetylase RimI-like enzyme